MSNSNKVRVLVHSIKLTGSPFNLRILAYLPVSADKFETCYLFRKNIYYHRNLLTINIYIKLKRKLMFLYNDIIF